MWVRQNIIVGVWHIKCINHYVANEPEIKLCEYIVAVINQISWIFITTDARSVVKHAQNVGFLAGFLAISSERRCFKRITSFIFTLLCCLTR